MSFHLPLLTIVLLLLGVGALLFALISLVDGLRFVRNVSRALRPGLAFHGRAVLLIPVRGFEPTLGEALEVLLDQDHPDCRVILIADPDDPAANRLEEWAARLPLALVRTRPLQGCSGKIAALLTGLAHVGVGDEIVVFADSDITPDRAWLRHLLAPFGDPRIAAVTGYRWYFPLRGGLGPGLQSAWNSAAAGVMFSRRWGYLWGGSYAIRRTVLEGVDIATRWKHVLSDDMVMTQTLRERGHRMTFAPRATVANFTGKTWREVVRWTNRQSSLALLYNPAMRRLTLPYALYAGSFVLGVAALGLLPLAMPFLLAAALLLSPVYLGLAKGALRRSAFSRAMPAFRDAFRRHRIWFYLGTLLLPFLMLYNVRKASRMSSFAWRGKVYRFSSADDIVVETES